MAFNLSKSLMVIAVAAVTACGAKTDTGRNANPELWPGDGSGQTPGITGSTDSELASKCFQKSAAKAPDGLKILCDNEIGGNPAFAKLHKILCADNKMIAALSEPSCGWSGAASTLNQHLYFFEMEPDKQKNYQDVHASIVHVPVSVDRFMHPLRIAFENYDEFKAQGYQWLAGTREHRNLSGTKWEQGIQYRFRANKDLYDIGYQGSNTLYQVDQDTFLHLNYATGDYARIVSFAQIVLYKKLPDNTALSVKLEHREVSSQGLYDRAKKTGLEMTRELMEKGYRNATKQ